MGSARADDDPSRRRGLHAERVAVQRVLSHSRGGRSHREVDRLLPGRLRRAVHHPLREGIAGRVRRRRLKVHTRPVSNVRDRVVRRPAMGGARADDDPGRRRGLHAERVAVQRVLCHGRRGRGHREVDGLLPRGLRRAIHRPLGEGVSGRVRRRGLQVHAGPIRNLIGVTRRAIVPRVRGDSDAVRRRGLHRQCVTIQRVNRRSRGGRSHREVDGLLPGRLRRAVHHPLREGIAGRVRGRGLQVHAGPIDDAGHRVVRRPAVGAARTDDDSGRRRRLHRQRVRIHRILRHGRYAGGHRERDGFPVGGRNERDGVLPAGLSQRPLGESVPGRVRRRHGQAHARPVRDAGHRVVRRSAIGRARGDNDPRRRRGLHRQRISIERELRHRRRGRGHRKGDGLLPGSLRDAGHRPLRERIPGRVRRRGLQVYARPIGHARQRVVRRAAVAGARCDDDPRQRRCLHSERAGVQRILRHRGRIRIHRQVDRLLPGGLRRAVHRPLREGVAGRVRRRSREVCARPIPEAGRRVVRRPALPGIRGDNDPGLRRGLYRQRVGVQRIHRRRGRVRGHRERDGLRSIRRSVDRPLREGISGRVRRRGHKINARPGYDAGHRIVRCPAIGRT